jgi:hypothetical protein
MPSIGSPERVARRLRPFGERRGGLGHPVEVDPAERFALELPGGPAFPARLAPHASGKSSGMGGHRKLDRPAQAHRIAARCTIAHPFQAESAPAISRAAPGRPSPPRNPALASADWKRSASATMPHRSTFRLALLSCRKRVALEPRGLRGCGWGSRTRQGRRLRWHRGQAPPSPRSSPRSPRPA